MFSLSDSAVFDPFLTSSISPSPCAEASTRRRPLPARLTGTTDYSDAAAAQRRALLKEQGIDVAQLAGDGPEASPENLAGNIENFIGYARIPVGVAGPLRIRGECADGDFYVPLATTEGALVASYHRGALLISQSGGAHVSCLAESVRRTPCFAFHRLAEAERFIHWLEGRREHLEHLVSRTSNHCRLIDCRPQVIGKEVYLTLEFHTGDAAGQNMVTLATDAICSRLAAESPVAPRDWFLEANMSGDKKASALSFASCRGKKVVAEAVIERKRVRRFLHVEPEAMIRYWQVSVLGGVQSGTIGVQGHYANALAAMFLACGQDVACVAEAAVGITRMDLTEDGGLYVSVSLPNVIVGTVGGGVGLPTARNCLEMLDCWGAGKARKFAAICGAVALAGEISIIGSMAAGDFGRAHATYGRPPRKTFKVTCGEEDTP